MIAALYGKNTEKFPPFEVSQFLKSCKPLKKSPENSQLKSNTYGPRNNFCTISNIQNTFGKG